MKTTTRTNLMLLGASLIITHATTATAFGLKPATTISFVSSRYKDDNKIHGPLHALYGDVDMDIMSPASSSSRFNPLFTPTPEPLSVNNRHSASDWLYNVFSLPRSSVLREIRNPVLTIAVWGGLVSLLQRWLYTSASPVLQKLARDMCVGSTPHSFLVSSLGLLLVFRTNSAYQRFYEGRKIWENILSISRNLSRTINLYENEVGFDRKQRLLNLVAAFPYLLRHHIRPGCLCESRQEPSKENAQHSLLLKEPSIEMVVTRHEDDKHAIGGTTKPPSYHAAPKRECWVDKRNLPWCLFSSETYLQQVAKAQNRPLWVCDRIGRELMDIPYGPNFSSRERLSLLSQVEKLTNTVGECERIHQTAVPLNYARHSLRSLTIWLFTLPFALVKDVGLLTGPVMGVIAWLLFGVYQIGYSIEDPFQGSLRLSILCDAIRNDVIADGIRYSAFGDTEPSLPASPLNMAQIMSSAVNYNLGQVNATLIGIP